MESTTVGIRYYNYYLVKYRILWLFCRFPEVVTISDTSCITYQVCEVEEYADGAPELHAEGAADHEVDAAALDGAVGGDRADRQHSRHQDRVRDGKLRRMKNIYLWVIA